MRHDEDTKGPVPATIGVSVFGAPLDPDAFLRQCPPQTALCKSSSTLNELASLEYAKQTPPIRGLIAVGVRGKERLTGEPLRLRQPMRPTWIARGLKHDPQDEAP